MHRSVGPGWRVTSPPGTHIHFRVMRTSPLGQEVYPDGGIGILSTRVLLWSRCSSNPEMLPTYPDERDGYVRGCIRREARALVPY
jgi:hypothetical protein